MFNFKVCPNRALRQPLSSPIGRPIPSVKHSARSHSFDISCDRRVVRFFAHRTDYCFFQLPRQTSGPEISRWWPSFLASRKTQVQNHWAVTASRRIGFVSLNCHRLTSPSQFVALVYFQSFSITEKNVTTRYLTIEQVADILKIKTASARNRLSRGEPMPPSVKVGRKRLFPENALEDWMTARIESNDGYLPATRKLVL